jgi:hypothetical protein
MITTLYSAEGRAVFKRWHLKKPKKWIRKLIEEESKKVPVPVKMKWFVKRKFNDINAPFSGAAFATNKNNTKSICLSAYALRQDIKYLRWLIRHELRHCEAPENKFRFHDVTLYDTGFEKPRAIGYFKEDFPEIACCDVLMNYFRNVNTIEEYLDFND